MKQGIILDFDQDGEAKAIAPEDPEDKLPECHVPCEHIILEETGLYTKMWCSHADRSVVDIYYEDGICPLNKWYTGRPKEAA